MLFIVQASGIEQLLRFIYIFNSRTLRAVLVHVIRLSVVLVDDVVPKFNGKIMEGDRSKNRTGKILSIQDRRKIEA